jgi:2-polyprenyl-3-methyl-5-hydroxy-6-metoxy-1,4-benzoquinol methylase
MSLAQSETQIRTQPKPNCPLCGESGEMLYPRLKDRLFEAPGSWNLKQCPNDDCGLIWPDPTPLIEDIGKAYVNYYTHSSATANLSSRAKIRQRFEMIYIRQRFGYPAPSPNYWDILLGFLFYHREGGTTFVRWKPGGRLLDVGCGSGDYLTLMKSLGWEVEGVEFDPAAVAAARKTGLSVRCGSLEEQAYPSESFDAIMMHHVIEHVPDPVASLKECARILKPGGEVLLFTPNSSSLTHSLFRECWRGLETPRHLHIFSPASAARALKLAGMDDVMLYPEAASNFIEESILLRVGDSEAKRPPRDSRFLNAFSRIGALFEGCAAKFKPSMADCLTAVAVKR